MLFHGREVRIEENFARGLECTAKPRRCLRIKFTNRVPIIRIPDKSWKRLSSSLSHMVWCSSGIFQVLEQTKQTKSPWFKSRKDFVYVCGAGFSCQKFRTNSSSLERSGILLRGPDREKPDRQQPIRARFARIPDRQKINDNIINFFLQENSGLHVAAWIWRWLELLESWRSEFLMWLCPNIHCR